MKRPADDRKAWQAIVVALFLVIILLQLIILSRLPIKRLADNEILTKVPEDLHTVALNWPPMIVAPHDASSGYVANLTWREDVRIVAVQVWMGNPFGVLWEGDVYLTLNNRGIFNNSTDQVIVHYQFDKHAESSAPHQLWFPIGSGGDGFRVKAGETVWVWFAFTNLTDQLVKAGDGQVIVYYVQA